MFPYLVATFCLIASTTAVGNGRSPHEAHGNPWWEKTIAHPARQDSVGAEVFRRQCAPCHGKEGKGDGPAAVAFNPHPSDLTDADGAGQLSVEELVAIIGNGRASMPAFAGVLSPEELQAVADYVRTLSKKTGSE